ncbi:MAG TPA: glycoside hydrolase family 16 protein [Nocardioides sp.]|nr:glycoside hydrolase family 16 protein [Nocardioides sp.]
MSFLLVVTALAVAGDAMTPGVVPTCGGEQPVSPVGGTYTCSFTDDFDGTTYDTSTWVAQDSAISGMTTGNHDCFVGTPDTIAVSDGAAHLSSRRTAAPFTCHSPYGDFTSQSVAGSLTTYNRFAQTYGRFEFRARFPATRAVGVHSALWLYPNKLTYGPWPKSGEIDVAEWFSNQPNIALPSVHYEGERFGVSSGLTCTTATPEDYHSYAVAWTPSAMYFYLDGRLCWQHSWLPYSTLVGAQPFDQPFNIVLAQAFGPGPNNLPTAATPDVDTLDVDWVRAWSWTPAGPDVSSQPKPAVGTALVRYHHRRRAG